jgi:hypothetical protein
MSWKPERPPPIVGFRASVWGMIWGSKLEIFWIYLDMPSHHLAMFIMFSQASWGWSSPSIPHLEPCLPEADLRARDETASELWQIWQSFPTEAPCRRHFDTLKCQEMSGNVRKCHVGSTGHDISLKYGHLSGIPGFCEYTFLYTVEVQHFNTPVRSCKLLLKLGTSGWIRPFSTGYQVWAWPQTACHALRSGRSLLWEVGAVCWTTHTCQTCHRYCQHLRVWTKCPKWDQGCLVRQTMCFDGECRY